MTCHISQLVYDISFFLVGYRWPFHGITSTKIITDGQEQNIFRTAHSFTGRTTPHNVVIIGN